MATRENEVDPMISVLYQEQRNEANLIVAVVLGPRKVGRVVTNEAYLGKHYILVYSLSTEINSCIALAIGTRC